MRTAGIIAEYNPFHNGHKYHIERTRDITGADCIIAVISGNYMQRGVPAITDKYTRAEMALRNGVDLVLELPLFYSAGSAEFFAMGAVSLLDKLGVADALCFGSECGNIHILTEIAGVLANEPAVYRAALQENLKKGFSYPRARSMALTACFSGSADYAAAVSSPNNILGIEYIKALLKRNSRILPYTIRREGSAYHDDALSADSAHASASKSSASAIRNSIGISADLLPVKEHVPDSVYQLLKDSNNKTFPVWSNDFSLLLKYKLLLEFEKGYTEYVDVNEDLSDRIKKNINNFVNFEQFCEVLKSKNMTYSRLSRCLIHILLNMKTQDLNNYIKHDYIYYARILGFKKTSGNLLHTIKKNASVPLISKLADASVLLDETGNSMLQKDIMSAHIYDALLSGKFHTSFSSEYEKPLVIL